MHGETVKKAPDVLLSADVLLLLQYVIHICFYELCYSGIKLIV